MIKAMSKIDHKLRAQTIGASEIAAVIGLSEYKTPLEVWLEKTGRKPPFEGNEHTKRGNLQEDMILTWMDGEISGTIVPNSKPFILEDEIASATPDGFEIDHKARPVAVVECKSTLKRIVTIQDDAPHFWLQCQWQMLVTGVRKAHLAIFGPLVSDYQRFEIEYNEAYCREVLQQATEWWEKHVVGDIPPPPVTEADALTMWPKDDGSTLEADPGFVELTRLYSELNAAKCNLEEQMQEARQRIVIAMGAAERAKFDGKTVCTWKADKNGVRKFKVYA
jgi:putative phage-type endonuclease